MLRFSSTSISSVASVVVFPASSLYGINPVGVVTSIKFSSATEVVMKPKMFATRLPNVLRLFDALFGMVV